MLKPGRSISSYVLCIGLFLCLSVAVSFAVSNIAANDTVFASHTLEPSSYPNISAQLSGNTTVSPDTAPTGVTSMNVSTDTNFKGRLEGDPATGVVRITDAHPAGTYILTVKAFDGATQTGSTSFTLTVTTPVTCSPVSFQPAVNLTAGTKPQAIAVGDFDGDGNQDLVAANRDSNNVSILLGNGIGGFGSATSFSAGSTPRSVAVGDFNGDGMQDLAVANNAASYVSILLGNGMGGFSAPTTLSVGGVAHSVAVGDFNGDGRQDLAVPNSIFQTFYSMVSVFLGNGAGGFSDTVNFEFDAGNDPQLLAVGDFNHDGNQDLAVTGARYLSVYILTGNGSGGFVQIQSYSGGNSQLLALGDFNGDGRQDLSVDKIPNLKILLGADNGSFSAFDNFGFSAGSSPSSVVVGDLNGDSKQDVAVANGESNYVAIRLGGGAGGFTTSPNVAAGTQPQSLAVGDFNGDGKQDLVVGNYGSNNISILLRQCAATPTATATPMAALSGTVTYGNAIGSPNPRYVSNVVMNVVEEPGLSVETTFPGGTYTLTGFGSGSYTILPTKTTGANGITSLDAAKIAQHIAGVSALTGNQLVVADTSGNGTISSFDAGQVARYAVSSPPYGSAGTWKFSPASRAYASVPTSIVGEDYSALLMGEISGNWTNTGARPVSSGQLGGGPERNSTVEFPKIGRPVGKEVIVPVSVRGVANKGVISYEFDLRYDPSVIRPQVNAVDLARTVSRGLSVVTNTIEPGLLRVVVYGAMPISDDGVLLNLRFTAVGKAGSVSPLSWERIMFNEGESRVNTTNGQVELF